MSKELAKDIIKVIGSAYFVGGCVRDFLLGLEPKDYDVATPLTPDQVKSAISSSSKAAYWHVIDTGLKWGTLTIFDVVSGATVEITSFRKDMTRGRHPNITFTANIMEDAARRDFTINSIYWDGEGYFQTFHNGITDLATRELRAVGNVEERLAEDPLRLLRAIRFAIKYDLYLVDHEAYFAAIPLLVGVSAERIWVEVKQIIDLLKQSSGPVERFDVVTHLLEKVLEFIFGKPFEIEIPTLWEYGPQSALYSIFLDNGVVISEIISKLKLSKDEARTLEQINIIESRDPSIYEAIHYYSMKPTIISEFWPEISDAEINMITNRKFPLEAKDILPFDDKPAAALARLKTHWISKTNCNPKATKEEYLELYRKLYDER